MAAIICSNFFKLELREMFNPIAEVTDPVYVGKSVLWKLDKDTTVKVEFIGSRVALGKYNAFQVRVVNLTHGEIDSTVLRFDDIIGNVKGENYCSVEPHISELGKHRWVTPLTVSQKEQLAQAVMCYISAFQRPKAKRSV